MTPSLTILISSAGRRVELIDCFRASARALGRALRVLAVDAQPEWSAACQSAEASFQVPRCDHPEFISTLLDLCRTEKVALLIPTIDPELEVLAAHRHRFEACGIRVAISSPDVIAIARDKLETHRFLASLGIATPRTETALDALRAPHTWTYPVLLKPRHGSSSIGQHRLNSAAAFSSIPFDPSGCVAQQFISGPEYTVNLFFDSTGLRCAIPHRRVATRSGEVSQAVTERVPALAGIAQSIASAWKGRANAALCFQAIIPPSGAPAVIEINARFGGGYPLAHRAGAPFAQWLLESALGLPTTAHDAWESALAMIRYDQSHFIRSATLCENPGAAP